MIIHLSDIYTYKIDILIYHVGPCRPGWPYIHITDVNSKTDFKPENKDMFVCEHNRGQLLLTSELSECGIKVFLLETKLYLSIQSLYTKR